MLAGAGEDLFGHPRYGKYLGATYHSTPKHGKLIKILIKKQQALMNFAEFQNVSSTTGQVKIGLCRSEGEAYFKCVEKVYGKGYKHEFDHVVRILERFPRAIQELGPHVHLVDKENATVYMEYLECETLAKFLSEIRIDDTGDQTKLRNLFRGISDFMQRLRDMGLCHGDFHARNVLVCADMKIRMIDIDTLNSIEDQGWCNDNEELGADIYRILVRQTKEQNEYAARDAQLGVEKMYNQKYSEVEKIIDSLGVDENIRKHMYRRGYFK